MLQPDKQLAQRTKHRGVQPRTALVIHDGSAFALAQWFRDAAFDVRERPLLSVTLANETTPDVAVVAVRRLPQRGAAVLRVLRELCWNGVPVLAVGPCAAPLVTLFGGDGSQLHQRKTPRLCNVRSNGAGLMMKSQEQFRVAVPAGSDLVAAAVGPEFDVVAATADGCALALSHVFRPIHALHPALLETPALRTNALRNFVRLVPQCDR